MNKKLSVSKIQKYNECQYKYDLMYNRQIARKYNSDTGPMYLGDLVHRGLAAALYAYHNNKYTDNNQAKSAAVSAIFDEASKKKPAIVIEDLVLEDEKWNEARDLAIEIASRTLDYLDVPSNYRSVVVNSQPLVEHQLEWNIPNSDFVFTGYIDWCCLNLQTGLMELWDFKVREKMQDESNDVLNQQTAIYQYVLLQKYGLHVPITVIGQIRSRVPEIPSVTQKTHKVSKGNITTTWDIYKQAMLDNNQDPYDPEYADIRNSLLANEDFWRLTRFVRNDKEISARFFQNFYLTGVQANDMIYPVRQFGYQCWKCPFNQWCEAELNGDDPEELIGTSYQRIE